MSILLFIAIVLIACNFVVSLVSAADLRSKRNRLAKLEERRDRTKAELQEAEQHRKMAEGTRAMHNRLKEEKQAEINKQKKIIEELAEITEEDREIKVASEEDKTGGSKDTGGDEHEISTRIPAMNRKASDKDKEAKSIRMRTPKR